MRLLRLKKSTLSGEIFIPPSKSHTLRAILFASLAKGKSRIDNYLQSPDTTAMIEACRLFGASITLFPTHINIEGTGGKIQEITAPIESGNSGIVLRFLTALAALSPHTTILKSDGSSRPMEPLLSALSKLRVKATSFQDKGFAPLSVQGPLQPGKTELSGQDSQHVSALLIAGSFAKGPMEIHVKNPGEKPWINFTLYWLKKLGIPFENHHFERYRLAGNATYEGFHYSVPGDFSTAAFPLVAALITNSELTLKNLDMDDVQGDKAIIPLLQKMGAILEIDPHKKEICVKKGALLSGTSIDVNDFIDALPILSVLGCFAKGKTELYNASVAKTKECDRILCITQELTKMGANILAHEEGITIHQSPLKGASVYSHQDHRIALSLATGALAAEGETTLLSPDCIAKTYPTFASDFKALNGHIELHEP